jgi:hypothetical protein
MMIRFILGYLILFGVVGGIESIEKITLGNSIIFTLATILALVCVYYGYKKMDE